jgi:Tfp pilus assembly protein PilN
VIDTLCGVLIDANIISEKKLKKLIDSNISATEKRIKEIEQLEKDDEIVSQIMNGFTGPVGEA